ncbi:alpha-keto acid decarboxylase family protein [Paraburkholderia youngii]|uniref:alpha-keto acid decarboxylase family protein n=1 Tax=Paraburkholderia youngii TaxID=2782701 RepID=UPI0015913384|nr:thiamine pyrophosphate-binding protein [Paraburkholderia youngii]NUX56721.1 alpha-keto acid decarboxylase family protein [Paraburkholderia youngii]
MRMQIGAFLARRLSEAGVRHLFGVPGDFNLSFLEQIQDADGIEFVGNCNELNAAYAADGYARILGLAAFITTFGVGDLAAIGGIAGAYAENVPVVHITGAPPLHAMHSGALVHHTLADGDYDNIGRCMAEFTIAQARITPANAAFEIDRVLRMCWLERRPVHLQLPSDVTHILVEVPDTPLALTAPSSDSEQLCVAAQRVVDALNTAHAPVLVVDADADRFDVTELVQKLSEKCDIPCASLMPAKGALDETSPRYLGIYAGAASAGRVRDAVENADCVIGVGLRFTDSSTGLFSHRINPNTFIDLRRHDLSIGAAQMPGVMMRDLLARIVEDAKPAVRPAVIDSPVLANATEPGPSQTDEALTHTTLWPRVRGFLRPGDVIIGEAGTAHAALVSMSLPAAASYIAAPTWGAVGYALPALFGSLTGAPSRRHLLFIGDGSFQFTVQELSSILRRDQKPVIFLLNNGGYTIERLILGARSAYNDVDDWRYSELPRVFNRRENTLSFVVKTLGELEAALTQAEVADRLIFIELMLPKMDAPALLKQFAGRLAEFDYGERGPRNPSPAVTQVGRSVGSAYERNHVVDESA